MNDRCTSATARRLKELGFEQPVPAPGQVWYDTEGDALIVFRVTGSQVESVTDKEGVVLPVVTGLHWMRTRFTYAPTAPDILRELGAGHALTNSIDGSTWLCDFMESTAQTTPFHKVTLLAFHENPAEACAEAWEAKQKQP